MDNIIFSDGFNAYALPFVFVLLGVLANLLGKPDSQKHVYRNDFAVCSTVLLLSISTVFADAHAFQNSAEATAEAFLSWVLILVFCLMLSLVHDRITSWIDEANGTPTYRKHLLWGIWLPNVVSVVIFMVYKASIG
ncbi:MAG: hypothetical protein QNJ09_11430 [Paracoccaceae bacterium]|nr:hypothetical protein [Paracoccaceae bacterium]